MTCPDIGYSMPRKKFDSGKIRVLILNVYAACPEPDTSPYFRFSQEYGFVSTNIATMTQLISHSERKKVTLFEHERKIVMDLACAMQISSFTCNKGQLDTILKNEGLTFHGTSSYKPSPVTYKLPPAIGPSTRRHTVLSPPVILPPPTSSLA